MRKLRIVTDEDGRPWIEQLEDGEWSRVEHSEEQPPLRVGEFRTLNASSIDEIADAVGHPQQKFAEEAQSLARHLSAAVPTTAIDALRARFAQAVPPVNQAEINEAKEKFRFPTRRSGLDSFEPPELPEPIPNPTYEVIAMLDKQNQILGEQRDDARREAEASAVQAQQNLKLAWAAIGITVVVGIAQIIVSIIQG